MRKTIICLAMLFQFGEVCLGAGKTDSIELSIQLSSTRFPFSNAEKMTLTITNPTKRIIQVWGFNETPESGPDLTPYLEFHLVQLVHGQRKPLIPTARQLPPLLSLYGRAYELKPGQSWHQTIEGWLPWPGGEPLQNGRYEVKVEFDDSSAKGFLPTPSKQGVGRVSSAPIAFEVLALDKNSSPPISIGITSQKVIFKPNSGEIFLIVKNQGTKEILIPTFAKSPGYLETLVVNIKAKDFNLNRPSSPIISLPDPELKPLKPNETHQFTIHLKDWWPKYVKSPIPRIWYIHAEWDLSWLAFANESKRPFKGTISSNELRIQFD